MKKEIEYGRETVVIINKCAGTGKDNPRKSIEKYWPSVAVSFLGLEEVDNHPELLAGKNVIVWGGDGTHGRLAELAREQDNIGYYVQLQGGSVCDMTYHLGTDRKWYDLTVDRYIKRIAHMFTNNEFAIQEFFPGTIVNGEPQNFLWTAGSGVAERILSRIEDARGWRWVKTARLIYGLVGIYRDLDCEETLQVKLPGHNEKVEVKDVNMVVNFDRFGGLKLPHHGAQVWLINKPNNRKEVWKTVIKLAVDAFKMKMSQNPTEGAVSVIELDAGAEVEVEGVMSSIQVDSEIKQVKTNRLVLSVNSRPDTKPIKFLTKK